MSGLHGLASERLDRQRRRMLSLLLVVATALLGLPSIAAAVPPMALPPTSTAAFSPAGIQPNGAATLTLTLTNPNATQDLSGVAFTDTLPANLVVATPNGLTNTCAGTVTATAGSGSVSLSAGTIAAASSCTVTVSVTSSFTGSYTTSTGPVSSTEGGTGADGTAATIAVANPPTISKSFAASSVPQGNKIGLYFTITNPNSNSTPPNSDVTLTGVSFTDALPAGMVVASPNEASSDCGGTLTAVPGSSSIAFSGGTIGPALPPDGAGGSCNLAVEVQITAGNGATLNDTSGPVSANESGPGATSNTATLDVTAPIAPPTLSKAFGAASIPVGGSTSLTFTLANSNTVADLVNTSVSDPLPSGLVAANPNAAAGTCLSVDSGTVNATPGAGAINISAVNLPPSASCTVTVNVTGTSAGTQTNTTGAPTAVYDDGSGIFTSTTGTPASASLDVVAPPALTIGVAPARTTAGGGMTLTFTIANPNGADALSGIAVSDALPSGLAVASPNGLAGSCGAGTITAVAGSTAISLSGGTLPPGGSCTFSLALAASADGLKTITTGPVTSTEGGTGTSASTSLFVGSPPTAAIAFSPGSILLHGTSTLSFTLGNPNPTATLTGVSLSDSLPSGLHVASPSGLTGGCGGGAITAAAGGSTITLTGASLAGAATCHFSLGVTGAATGVKHDTTGAVTATETGPGATATATLSVLSAPTVSVSDPRGGASYAYGAKVKASYSCHDDPNGPGIASCRGTAKDGADIATTPAGRHTFTVTATSKDGLRTTQTVSYSVALPSNAFRVMSVHAYSDGHVTFTVVLPGPGTIDVLETAWTNNVAAADGLLQPARGRFVFARAHAVAHHAGRLTLTVWPNAEGRRLVAHHRYPVVIRLWITYTPTGGRPRSVGFYGLRITPIAPVATGLG